MLNNHTQEVVQECNNLHPTDLALLFYNLTSEDQKKLIDILQNDLNPEIIPWFNQDLLEILLECVGYNKFAKLVSKLDVTKIIKVIIALPEEIMEKVTLEFNENTRIAVEDRFKYPEKTLGRIMQTDYVAAPMWWTIKDLNNFLSLNSSLQKCNAIIVINAEHHPVGTVYSVKAIGCSPLTKIEEIMNQIEVFHENTAAIEAIISFKKYELMQSCIVDKDNKLIGYINFTQILNASEEETEEETMQLHGIFYDCTGNQSISLIDNILMNIKSRIPWICVNLLVAFIVANIVINFENIISHYIYAASLMSIVASSAGSSGAQTVAVTVRLISKTQIRLLSAYIIILSEVLTGFTNGMIISMISFLISLYMYQDYKISLVFAIAILFNFIISGVIGSLTPVVLEKLNLDPASGSNVIVSAVTDIFGFFVFLYMINWMHQFI